MGDAVVFKPNDKGDARIPLRIPHDKEFTIGRSPSASLDIPKYEVSRLHCIIWHKNDRWIICDKSSTGTTINGFQLQKNTETRLMDGDKILISILKNSFVFCCNPENCPNDCKDVPLEENCNDDKCVELQKSIKKSKNGMQELRSLQTELNNKFNLQLHGLQERFQEQLKSQAPAQIKQLKEDMEKEKSEIQEKYTKELTDLGNRLQESQADQEMLRQQIDILFQERGRDSENLRELEEDLNQLKRQKESMGEINEALEKRVKEMSDTIEAEKENAKKQCLETIGDIMESELQCCVCNELFVKATAINCSHTFCEKCINSWLRNNKVCPMCRAVVTSRTRALVMDSFIDKAVESLSDELKERRKTLLREREEEAKTAPPPPPIGQPQSTISTLVRAHDGSIQVIQNGVVRFVNAIQTAGVRPGAPIIIRAPTAPGAAQPGSQHGRNVRPRLPNTPGPAVIDLTGISPGGARSHHIPHRRRHGRS